MFPVPHFERIHHQHVEKAQTRRADGKLFDEIGLLIPPSPFGDQELYFRLGAAELGSSILTIDPVESTGCQCFFEVSRWFDDGRAREKNVNVTGAQYGEFRGIFEILTIEDLRAPPD